MIRRLALAGLLSLAFASPAVAGPSWISIELPANPWNAATRGAFPVVHADHHGSAMASVVSGTATRIVNEATAARVPIQQERAGAFPRRITAAELDAALAVQTRP